MRSHFSGSINATTRAAGFIGYVYGSQTVPSEINIIESTSSPTPNENGYGIQSVYAISAIVGFQYWGQQLIVKDSKVDGIFHSDNSYTGICQLHDKTLNIISIDRTIVAPSVSPETPVSYAILGATPTNATFIFTDSFFFKEDTWLNATSQQTYTDLELKEITTYDGSSFSFDAFDPWSFVGATIPTLTEAP